MTPLLLAAAPRLSDVHEPTPEQYNPPLTWRSHAWRTAGVISISAVLWPATAKLQWEQARPLFWLDLGLGLVSLVLTFFRRRWPFAIATVTALLGSVSISSAGPGVLASVSLATRRVIWQIVVAGLAGLVGAMIYPLVGPSPTHDPWWITFAFGLAFTIAILVWGMYLGSRRELLWTLRDRAERAEAEQELRVEQGRSNERASATSSARSPKVGCGASRRPAGSSSRSTPSTARRSVSASCDLAWITSAVSRISSAVRSVR